MHPAHVDSLRAALFGSDWYELTPPADWGDEPGDWERPERFDDEPPMWPHEGWAWENPPTGVVRGPDLGRQPRDHLLAAAGRPDRARRARTRAACCSWRPRRRCRRPPRCTGSCATWASAGCWSSFTGLLMGRAKAWERDRPNPPEREARVHRRRSAAAVQRAMAEYHPDAMIVFDVDIGHTDPQLIIPYGGTDPGRRPATAASTSATEPGARRRLVRAVLVAFTRDPSRHSATAPGNSDPAARSRGRLAMCVRHPLPGPAGGNRACPPTG